LYVDAPTIACLVDELEQKAFLGRVQQTLQVGDLAVGFEIYANRQRHYLLIDADPKHSRCLLTPDRLRRGTEKPTPLGLLLRKYVKGASLVAVRQPPWERIIEFDFSGDEGETTLIAELMGKLSNIILTVDGDILDSVKRIKSDQNRYRVVMPGKQYIAPPPQEKTSPEQVTDGRIAHFLAEGATGQAWRALVNGFVGISPLLAREIIYRACGDAEADAQTIVASKVYSEFENLVQDIVTGEWDVCIAPADNRKGYRAFAPYNLTFLENTLPIDSISEAMALYFGAPVGIETYDRAKKNVRKQIEDALDRTRGKLYSLKQQSVNDEKIETLRKQGELVLAYGPALEPGTTEFAAQYDVDGPDLTITVDPALSVAANAQTYFDKYEKAKSAAQNIPQLEAQAAWEKAYLEQLLTDLDIAESWPEIDSVRETLQDKGYWRGQRTSGPRGGRPGIRRFTEGDGFVILVGRNSQQNHELITERAAANDLWLHARNIPGSHVIIKDDGRPIPDDVIQRAARLAAYYSKNRGEESVEVDITQRRYVRPIKGAGPGMVTYRNEETISVKPSTS